MTTRHPERRTERLWLRQWRESDLDAFAEMDADPDVMRYIGDGSPGTRERTAAALGRVRAAWDERGYGLFAAEEIATGEPVGWVGLAVPAFLPEIMPTVEIGWRLRRRSWGRGYATEAAREVLAFAFAEAGAGATAGAGLERVVSICHVDHHASMRVMTKLGMTYDRTTRVPSHGQPVRVMALTREAHRASA
ncbi:GNAT family N-acetyltransferase [Streptomyces hawaiiensis]|uniref:GNAT family N-acetyltransferase n=1 Tax=Streptomyces hawaiiensis TaxID=67305 RepID=A0A6G5RF91_9ACTN|nr:GNAT family N-acetyltransferase [Streptomyces hawaiiensis]QCD56680.1 GNAT family N-acetyltransferase [Streptomyces hawaiiensis]